MLFGHVQTLSAMHHSPTISYIWIMWLDRFLLSEYLHNMIWLVYFWQKLLLKAATCNQLALSTRIFIRGLKSWQATLWQKCYWWSMKPCRGWNYPAKWNVIDNWKFRCVSWGVVKHHLQIGRGGRYNAFHLWLSIRFNYLYFFYILRGNEKLGELGKLSSTELED